MKKLLVGSLPNIISSEFLSLQEDRSIQEKGYREIAEEVNDSLFARLGCLKILKHFFAFPRYSNIRNFQCYIQEFFVLLISHALNRIRASNIKSNQNKIRKNNVYTQWSESALL